MVLHHLKPLVLTLLAAAAPAQVTGDINRDAPTVTQSVEFANGAKLEIRYTAIHFGQGLWQGIRDDPQKHESFNELAKSKPLGEVTTSDPVVAGGNLVPAGVFDLYVTVHEEDGWVLNVCKRGVTPSYPIIWHLHLPDCEKHHPRLKLALELGDGAREASFTIAFGKKETSVPLEVRKSPAKKATDEKTPDREPPRGKTKSQRPTERGTSAGSPPLASHELPPGHLPGLGAPLQLAGPRMRAHGARETTRPPRRRLLSSLAFLRTSAPWNAH